MLHAATLAVSMLVQAAAPGGQEKPLPDRTQFLTEFQVKRRGIYRLMGNSDDTRLLSQYTYRDTVTEISLDSKGAKKGSQTQVYERIPTRVVGYIYERQIVKNGVPLTVQELEKQDKKNEEEVAKIEAGRQKQNEANLKRRSERRKELEKTLAKQFDKQGLKGEERQRAMEAGLKKFDDILNGNIPAPPGTIESSSILQASDFQIAGRETLDGRSVIVLTFKPKRGYKGDGDFEKILQHAAGKIWVSEEDYEMMKIEAEVQDTISFGFGLLAKVQPGSHAVFEWRKFNNEVWLPYHEDFTAKVRILLVKGEYGREIHQYSDFKKYTVSTEVKFEGSPKE